MLGSLFVTQILQPGSHGLEVDRSAVIVHNKSLRGRSGERGRDTNTTTRLGCPPVIDVPEAEDELNLRREVLWRSEVCEGGEKRVHSAGIPVMFFSFSSGTLGRVVLRH